MLPAEKNPYGFAIDTLWIFTRQVLAKFCENQKKLFN